MARIHRLYTDAESDLKRLIKKEGVFQSLLVKDPKSLRLVSEYLFLSGYKIWENFLEKVFVAQARYNDPVSGRRCYPYLQPRTESHALELLKLEKDYLDWTSPDNVIKRAEICFRSPDVITVPIKSSMEDLRDAKKIRNFVAHGSDESRRLFKSLCVTRLGMVIDDAGKMLLTTKPGETTHFGLFYLEMFRGLVASIGKS